MEMTKNEQDQLMSRRRSKIFQWGLVILNLYA
jgi:hypothetical protein